MLKLKYYFYTILLLLFISFPNKSFSDNHNLKEVIELMQKDLSTLERAVYSENFSLNQQSNNADINMDQNSEEVLTRHLLKLSENPLFGKLTNIKNKKIYK